MGSIDLLMDAFERVRDGVHPAANGHLIMAYAFLKGLGCDGNVGTITLDLAGNHARPSNRPAPGR